MNTTMTAIERRWARDVWDTMFPRCDDARLPVGVADLDVSAYLDDIASQWDALSFFGLRAAVVIVSLASIVMLRTWRPLHRLNRAERLRVIERLYDSRIYVVRQLVMMLKATGGFLFGAAPGVREALAPGRSVGSTSALTLRRRST